MANKKPRKLKNSRGSEVIKRSIERLESGEEHDVMPITGEELKWIEREYEIDPQSAIDKYNEMVHDLQISPSFCGFADWTSGQLRICKNPPFNPANGRANGRCKQHYMSGELQYQDRAIEKIHDAEVKAIYLSYQDKFMTEQEKALYIAVMNWFTKEEEDYTPIDLMVLDRGLRSYINAVRKEMQADDFGVPTVRKDDIDFDTKFLRAITTLGLDRKFRISKKPKEDTKDMDIFDMMGDGFTDV